MMEIVDLELEGDDLIEDFQFPETLDGMKEVNGGGIGVNDHLPELHESTEPERNQRNGRYNMRKSLAWDSAFFTSAGVLDPEELSSMITKTDKKEKRVLPGIQEDISGSTESISTLQSDSLTLESGEDDLFLDIRASIQRSSKKASNFTNSSTKITAMVLDGTAISSPKKDDIVSQNKIPRPGMKKTSTLQTIRMSKSQLKPTGKIALARSLKQDPVQSQVGAIGMTRDTNSVIPKPHKSISSSGPSTAAKRESVGIGRVKSEYGSSKQAGSVPGKLTQPPKVSALGGSRKVPSKAAMSSKCSSLGSSMTSSVQSTRSSTSSDSSINTSSGNAVKPTLMTARRNVGKSSNISSGPSGSGSIPKTPSKAQPKNKLPAPTLSAYLKSTKSSSNVSPASSISEWSSVSSTTSSVVNPRSHNTRTSFDTSSCRSVDGDNAHLDNVSGQKAERQGKQGAVSSSNTSRKSSTSGTLQAPGKPSGLRLPSPKIGFFDGSTPRTPNGNQRSKSSLHPVIPKSGAAASTPTRSSNSKLKNAKVPMPRTATSLASMKAGSPKAASPASSQGKSHASVIASSVSTDKNDSSSSSLGLKVSGIGEIYPEAVEVEAGNSDNQVVNADTHAHDTDNSGDLCLNKSMSSGDIKTATVEGNYVSGSEYVGEIGDGLIKDEPNKISVPSFETTAKDKDPENCQGEELVGDKRDVYQKNDEPNSQLLIDTTGFAVSSTADASDPLKNITYSDECVEMPKELVIQVPEAVEIEAGNSDNQVANADTPAHDTDYSGDLCLNKSMSSGNIKTATVEGNYVSGPEYVGEIGDGLIKDERNKISIPSFEATAKDENPENWQGEELVGDKRDIYQKNDKPNSQLLIDTTELVVSSTADASDPLKNISYCDECVDLPKELVIQVAEAEHTAASLPSLDSIQIRDGLTRKSMNSVLTSEATHKDNDPAHCQQKGLTGEKRGICQNNDDPNFQFHSVTSECVLSSAAASDAAAYRPPFAPKNFFDSDEHVDKSQETKGFALPSSGSEYISQIEDGLVGDELNKNSAPTSGAAEKENNPAVYQGNEGLAGENGGIYQKNNDPKHQLLIDTSECLLSSPFAFKNLPCSNVTDKPTEPVIQVALAENAGFSLPSLEERDEK